MPIVTTDERLDIHYESEGVGIPVLFIHPPGMGLQVFHHQKKLSTVCRTIMYDIRGHGKSGDTKEPLSIPLLAKDIKAFIEALGIDQIVLCGYSSGGSVAQEFALSYPEATKAVILSGGFPEVNDPFLFQQFQLGIRLLERRLERLMAKAMAKTHFKSKTQEKACERYILMSDVRLWKKYYEESLRYTCLDRLHQLQAPLLLLTGQYECYFRHYLTIYEQRVWNVKKMMIANAFHQLPTLHGEEFNHVLQTFISALEKEN